MDKELLLHKNVRQAAERFVTNPSHALLITGPDGGGKQALAEFIITKVLNISTQKLPNYPYFYLIQKPQDKTEISIEAIRSVINKLKLRTSIDSAAQIKRVILIDGAHHMSAEAQNALLKAIEEPPAATVFILTARSDSAVLPTISSRTQKLQVGPVSLPEVLAYYKNEYKDNEIEAAWRLSGGLCGLLTALLQDDAQHPLKQAVEASKKLLVMNKYDRLLFVDGYVGQKRDLTGFLDALGRILTALNHAAVNSDNNEKSKKLIAALKLVDQTSRSLDQKASPRLALMNLVLNLQI